jgi:hypothetical protein
VLWGRGQHPPEDGRVRSTERFQINDSSRGRIHESEPAINPSVQLQRKFWTDPMGPTIARKTTQHTSRKTSLTSNGIDDLVGAVINNLHTAVSAIFETKLAHDQGFWVRSSNRDA